MIKAYGRRRLQEITAHNQKRIEEKLARKATRAPDEKQNLVLNPVHKMVASSTDLFKRVIQLGRKQSRSAEDMNSLEKLRQKYENGLMPSDANRPNHYQTPCSQIIYPNQAVSENENLIQRVLSLGQNQHNIRQSSSNSTESSDSDSNNEKELEKPGRIHGKLPLLKQHNDIGSYYEIPVRDSRGSFNMIHNDIEDETISICHSSEPSITSLEKIDKRPRDLIFQTKTNTGSARGRV